ncbi:histidine kinase [Clostridium botulinum B2 128]|uniref:sensor histidine kinase n=1 Tax=Clostridium botulinum TaxID=1491 RepID=UPI000581EC2C|nr:HAMP domain-containing sensor histidine kinase [Clostridium botulinum]KEI76049.1 histidine kinase [Clostridium botulinum B2 128]KEI89736.1 histidine kinase [Clostridium botulinum B2 433]NFI78433.1 HAMP domain-containing histidine kinase [Clostridium botulinum]NFI83035.1 HAMP domain-containing histidine kinase [Clostridium botulinum]NFJ36009.1 HAMP domain-containing histidine kinase [Clostridium botulinum]
MINSIKDQDRLKKLLGKNIIVIFLIILSLLFGIFFLFKNVNILNSRIEEKEKVLFDINKELENIKKNNNNFKNLSYDIWLKQCASTVNLYIYKNTNFLKILSQNSQETLDKKSKDFKIIRENNAYDKLVKFIIIDKTKKTFLTNDTDNLDFIKKNLNLFSEENGELFNYVSNKGTWYNISYNSESSPAYSRNPQPIMENPNNYVEAYWFPKNYSYKKEDFNLIKNILKDAEDNYKNDITNGTNAIKYLKKDLTKINYLIAICAFIITILLLTLYFIGKENVLKGIRNSFIIKLFKSINEWFETRTTFFKAIVFSTFTLLTVIITMKILSGDRYMKDYAVYVLFYIVFILSKFIKFCNYIDEIIKGTNKIISGDLDFTIKEKGDKSLLILSQNINKINKGFKISIEDQIKNEKLKSELVANISHDLKTPLTSIINYTDILIKEKVSEDEKEEFLKILNRKSLKLKTLIEDLFEISKINSGKVKLNKQQVDVVELLNQSIAEYSDTEIYKNKNLTFILKTFLPEIKIDLDGNRMSRVFENLINNSLKYSLSNTRIYVEIEDIVKGIKISFKNVSYAPLDFDQKEIFERFTRGDKSRTSDIEGSGLGLAIAKSIVELHNGIMYIDFDGDLFKAIIELYYQ